MNSLQVAARGMVSNADTVAKRIGLQNRFQLARLLRREALPPLRELGDWICILQLLWEADVGRTPLLRLARVAGLEPATCYRRCRRTLHALRRSLRRRAMPTVSCLVSR